MLELTYGFH